MPSEHLAPGPILIYALQMKLTRQHLLLIATIARLGCGLNLWRTVREVEQLGDARLADAGKIILAQTSNIMHDLDASDANSDGIEIAPEDEVPESTSPAPDSSEESTGDLPNHSNPDGTTPTLDAQDEDFAAERDIARIYTHTYASDLFYQVIDRSEEIVYAGLNSLGEKPRCGPENGYSVLRMEDGSKWSLLCLWTADQTMRIEIGEPIANRRKLALAVGLKANLPMMVMLMILAALYFVAKVDS